MIQLSSIIRSEVESSGISRIKLASAVGISRTSLFHILRGTALPKRATLDRILEQLQLGAEISAEINHAYESDRLNTIKSARKEVRAARDLFRASLLGLLQPSHSCRVVQDGFPDFRVTVGDDEFPVFAEMKIMDHYRVLGRTQVVRFHDGDLGSARWKAWVCVSVFEPIYDKYQQDFDSFNVKIVTPDSLITDFSEMENAVPVRSQQHVLDDILCIT
ncbi:MAG: helix-turn-helix transcriptional regulator [Opitutales bacterium]|nr:helix-turn-helix transcriptional regulator [Opitutales bacterium]